MCVYVLVCSNQTHKCVTSIECMEMGPAETPREIKPEREERGIQPIGLDLPVADTTSVC